MTRIRIALSCIDSMNTDFILNLQRRLCGHVPHETVAKTTLPWATTVSFTFASTFTMAMDS